MDSNKLFSPAAQANLHKTHTLSYLAHCRITALALPVDSIVNCFLLKEFANQRSHSSCGMSGVRHYGCCGTRGLNSGLSFLPNLRFDVDKVSFG